VNGGEEAFVAWLARRLPGVGDDTAPLLPRRRTLATVDQQIEGTHFLPGLDPRLVGRRLLRVNLSDLAASGARPLQALVALGVPEEVDPRPLVEGLLVDAKRFGVRLIGGDVARSPVLSAALTLLGETARGAGSLARDRARPGQALWLGGPVGESALGCELLLREVAADPARLRLPQGLALPRNLRAAARAALRRHLLPEPQLALGRWLAARGRASGAAMDVSDGLAKDLGRLTTASGVGAELDLPALRRAVAPRHEALAAALGLDPIALALAGGEDYVLLFTLPPDAAPPPRFGATRIGRVSRGRALRLVDRDGHRHPMPRLGWDHLGGA
jgi:thiamine-monophosphate kinase